jgi:hypothetical protein
VPGAPLPDPATPAPPRFLPRFDNALLSHADRTRIIADDDRRRIIASGGMGSAGTLLVDGFVRGTWKTEPTRGTVTLLIEPFGALSKKDRDALAKEGERLLRFVAEPECAEAFEVRFAEP